MKKVFFGLMMMVFASSAYASVPIATVDNVSLDIAKIELSSDGVISVTLRKTKEVVAKAIAPANFNLLNNDSNILATVAIQTSEQPIRCMIMLPPWQPTLSVSSVDAQYQFTGELKEILSYQSCAMGTLVAPALPGDKTIAQELESSLVLLANEILN